MKPLRFNSRVQRRAIALVLCISDALAGQNMFSARDFLLVREWKLGVDVSPGTAPPLALHSRGVFVAGAFQTGYGSQGPPSAPSYQAFLRRYDLSGNETWTRQVLASDMAFPSALALDSSGLYVAGHLGLGNSELFLRKYDDGGLELWSRQIRVSENGYHLTAGLETDASGVYLAAWDGQREGLVRKYSAAGDELWSRGIAVHSLQGLAVNQTGVYLTGSNAAGGFVRKYTPAGDMVWNRQLSSHETEAVIPAAVAVGPSGIYVGGAVYRRTGSGTTFLPDSAEALLRKLDESGNEIWSRRFGASPFTAVASLALDASGVFAAGNTHRSLPGQCKAGNGDVFVRKYDIAGNEVWTRQFGTSGYDFAGRLAIDPTGMYISGGTRGGTAHGSVFLSKLPLTQTVSSGLRPRIWWECVVNAASYVGGGVAPGEIVTIFGESIGPSQLVHAEAGERTDFLTATLAGTRILFDGIAAPLVYVSASQSSAVVPYGVSEKPRVDVQVEFNGVRSDGLTVPVLPARPGIFTLDGSGGGRGAILNEDGRLNSPDNPAAKGFIIVMYATGEGLTEPAGVDGMILRGVLPKPRLPVSVYFDNPAEEGTISPAEILYAGGVSNSVAGLLQINVRVPTWVRTGSAAPLYLQIGPEAAESGITIAVR
jgi:uncharacterized protein (TIGR03437 family)